MSNPITNARALLASRDATSKFAGYQDRKLADAMRELLREVERIRAEEARCIDAADAATREDERRHAEVIKAAMERERLLRGERDEALRRGRLEGASAALDAVSNALDIRDGAFRADHSIEDSISPSAIVAALEARDAR